MPRRFWLHRHADATGTSGVGRVADGIQWHDGTATLRWRTERSSTAHYDSVADIEHIHGHGGQTVVEWVD